MSSAHVICSCHLHMSSAHVLCIKIETKKCKNDFRKDFQSAKMTKRANPVIPFFAEFCPVTPFYISFSDALQSFRTQIMKTNRTSNAPVTPERP